MADVITQINPRLCLLVTRIVILNKYINCNQQLGNVKQEKDGGVTIISNLKSSHYCLTKSRKKVNVFDIKKFSCKSPDVMKRLYTTFVRSHLTRFNAGHRITLRTITYWKEYKDERQNTILHCLPC